MAKRGFMDGKKKCCTRCGERKLYRSFSNKLLQSGARSFSSVCRRCSYLKWKMDNPMGCKATQKRGDEKRRASFPERRRQLFAHIGQFVCLRCGIGDERVLQFHHRNPDEKEIPISYLGYSMERLKSEVEKCDVLCANCHIILHCERRHDAKKTK